MSSYGDFRNKKKIPKNIEFTQNLSDIHVEIMYKICLV